MKHQRLLRNIAIVTSTLFTLIPLPIGIKQFVSDSYSVTNQKQSLKNNNDKVTAPENIRLEATADDVHEFVGTQDWVSYADNVEVDTSLLNEFRIAYEANGRVLNRVWWFWDDAENSWYAYAQNTKFIGHCLYKTAADNDWKPLDIPASENSPDRYYLRDLPHDCFSEFYFRCINTKGVFTRYLASAGPWWGTPILRTVYSADKETSMDTLAMIYYAPTTITITSDANIDWHQYGQPLQAFVDYDHSLTEGSGPQEADQNAITWSLGDNAPSEVSIDASTGAITWSDQLATGEYDFDVNCASNLQLSDGSTYGDGPDGIKTSKRFHLTVNKAPDSYDFTSGSSVINNKYDIGGQEQYQIDYTPKNQYIISDVNWSTDVSIVSGPNSIDPSYITISPNGTNPLQATLTYSPQLPIGQYQVNIKATNTFNEKVSAIYPVTITISEPDPTNINVTGEQNIQVVYGNAGTSQYQAFVSPELAISSVNWEIVAGNPSPFPTDKITIDPNGQLRWTADLQIGTTYTFQVKATSTVLANISGYIDVSLQILAPRPTEVVISGDNDIREFVNTGGTRNYQASVKPELADQNVTWSIETKSKNPDNQQQANANISINPTSGQLTWTNALVIDQYDISISATTNDDTHLKGIYPVSLNIVATPTDIEIVPDNNKQEPTSQQHEISINAGKSGNIKFDATVNPIGAWQQVDWSLSFENNPEVEACFSISNQGVLSWNNKLPVGGPYLITVIASSVDKQEVIGQKEVAITVFEAAKGLPWFIWVIIPVVIVVIALIAFIIAFEIRRKRKK